MTHLYATCAAGLASLLAEELKSLDLADVRIAGSGVQFTGELQQAYKVCLWSRVANRVLWPLLRADAPTPEALYRAVQQLDWSEHLHPDGTLAVDFYTAQSAINHSHFGALKVKDAIVDQFRDKFGQRPNVERAQPDIRVNVYLFRDSARIALDLSGDSLHRRAYRSEAGQAPLKENLAAALLLALGWPAKAKQGLPFTDPMCGSGTLLIEAAMMAGRRAPGRLRSYFGFNGWRQHDAQCWQNLCDSADAQASAITVPIVGRDRSAAVVEHCAVNIQGAGFANDIEVGIHDIADQPAASLQSHAGGLLVTNPPYGERLAVDAQFHAELGQSLSRHYGGWQAALFTASSAPYQQSRLPFHTILEARNGAIDCVLLSTDIPTATKNPAQKTSPESVDTSAFVHRLAKNARTLKGWLKQHQIKAYRLYDADLPEFALAIDVYESDQKRCVVQEYQAPNSVNASMAALRLQSALAVLPDALQIDPEQVHFRVRERHSGSSQYEKTHASKSVTEMVTEAGAQLEVNFSDYLDTGLFLDHRPVRRYLQAQARDKRFLNLFAYTATASVAAMLGGAAATVSVDLSKTYCDWARRNLDYNHADPEKHQVIRADVLSWLAQQSSMPGTTDFDLILLDPPTFSNSNSMDKDWNVQHDHVGAIDAALALLAPGGRLIFSNNFRRFKLDQHLLDGRDGQLQVEDRSRWSIDRDFQRSPRIHQCWFIRKNKPA